MSFSNEVKRQLYKAEIKNTCCASAELFGILCQKSGRIPGENAFIKRLMILAGKSGTVPYRFGVASARNGG